MHDPPNPPAGADTHDAAGALPDGDREFEAGRTRLVARLVDDGFALARATQLVDAWEAEAIRRGLPLGSTMYWEQAPAWIGEQVDAELTPPAAVQPFLPYAFLGAIAITVFAFQFVHGMLTAALGIADVPAFLIACAIVGGALVVLARRSGVWAGIRGLPGRVGRPRARTWALAPLAVVAPLAILLLVAVAPLPSDVRLGVLDMLLWAPPIIVGAACLWAAPRLAARARTRGRNPRYAMWWARLTGLVLVATGGYAVYVLLWGRV